MGNASFTYLGTISYLVLVGKITKKTLTKHLTGQGNFFQPSSLHNDIKY